MLSNSLRRLKNYAQEHPVEFTLILLGVTIAVVSTCILPVLGFSAAGPVAGSIAAGWQSSIGLVSAGSLFALLQSAAMGGAAMMGIVGFGLFGAVVASLAAFGTIKEDKLEKIKDAGIAVLEGMVRVGEGVSEFGKKLWGSWGKK